MDAGPIIEAGLAAGLTACGIASCDPSDHAAALDAWLARGAHGPLDWLAETAETRKDLRRRWPWARSALVGAVSYLAAPRDRHAAPGILPYVARCAWSADYHRAVTRRMAAWLEAVERIVGAPYRYALLVDTASVLEREMAVRAGLGWIGKNTLLIGPQGDSWRVLGVVLTELDLLQTGPNALDRCGSCQACMDACPTAALPEPWFLDASLCLSTWSVETNVPMPEPLRAAAGDWAFGCDICQEVCPWNRRVAPADDPEFTPRERLATLTLGEVARADVPAFRAMFRDTPLLRPKRAGMVRNALIAGTNIGDPDVLAAARELVDDPEETVRETARWSVAVSAARRSGS